MSFSVYLRNKFLNHLFNKSSFTIPTIYVGLSLQDPLEDGSGLDEPAGAEGYTRVGTVGATWTTSTTGFLQNSAVITFPIATGSWGIISHFALLDDPTAGNMLWSGSLVKSIPIYLDDIRKFEVGDLKVILQ